MRSTNEFLVMLMELEGVDTSDEVACKEYLDMIGQQYFEHLVSQQ